MLAIKQKFIQALPTDNPYLDPHYIDVLKESFKHRPELLKAYLYGSWQAFEGSDQVIKDSWLELCEHRSGLGWPYIKEYLVCDPARFGDDETVIYRLNNTLIVEEVIMPQCRTTEISSRLAVMSRDNKDCQVVVESIGADIGAGVIDELLALGVETIQYNPSAKSIEPEKYYNMRAEVWDTAAKILASGIIDKTSNFIVYNKFEQTLRNQLCVPKYQFRNGKLLIESKDDIKERLGCSPDRADTYIIALWAWQFIDRQEDEQKTTYRSRNKEQRSAMTC